MIARDRAINILFVTWDAPGAPYLESLFLPIFVALAKARYRFHVLQFSWGSDGAPGAACAKADIPYRRVRVFRRPVAAGSLASAVAGSRDVRRAVADWNVDLLLPRSYLPALAANLARTHKPILLDADGLPNDERREFGGSDGIVASLLDRLEIEMVRRSDRLITRTERAIDVLHERTGVDINRFDVVPNGRSRSAFTPLTETQRAEGRKALGIDGQAPLIIYAGSSVSGKYQGDRITAFAAKVCARRDDAQLLILTPEVDASRRLVDAYPSLASTVIRHVPSADVPALLGLADAGLSLINSTFSMKAASAIKTGEYLLCGLPVIATSGVGDIEDILDQSTGYVLDNTDLGELSAAADWFVEAVMEDREGFRERCRRLGEERFSLEASEVAYRTAIEKALG